ncbi:Regulator of chromosome condensation (RCC1) [Phytophthora megakarya]|uniref:Regulator of chromosome condensation (RCC1) n=1 Tax=Phytophthora megakarya TaxID=4795 RepID=A0A225VJI1_9STRA|nr:Regulator of chromosome condensation (RCC1) [Phytophthora megakarya]
MHSLVVDSNGRAWAWGCNTFGQLGVGSDVPMLHTPTLVVLPSDVRAQHVAAGFAHSAMISTQKELLSFGWGLYNQLGHGSFN